LLPGERYSAPGPGRPQDGPLTPPEALRLDVDRAAVVVIDAQNDFCHPDGLQAKQGHNVGRLREPLARVASFLPVARRVGVPVIFVRNLHGTDTDTPAWLARHPDPDRQQSCQDGTWGAEFCVVHPEPHDVVIDKHRYSAFAETALLDHLGELGRDSLLFTGFTTNVCVESSLREAVCRDLFVTLVADCCGAYTDAAHQRTVDAVAAGFGVVTSSDRIQAAWHGAAAPRVPHRATTIPRLHGAGA
jgi:ureidoacrylate peracid hydrolase